MNKAIGILLLGALVLTAGAVFAGDLASQGRMDLDTVLAMQRQHGPAYNVRAMFEGFEGGVVPATWTAGVQNAARTWGVSNATTTGSLEGDYCAFVGYDLSVPQNETISFDQAVSVAGNEYVLTFWMAGSRDDSWSLNAAETVEVNGMTVFDFDTATNSDFVWEKFSIDLSAYDGQTVTITFRYAGVDGDLHVLDAVMVDDGTGYDPPPPPPAPENDVCSGAIDLQDQSLTTFEVDLCEYTNQASPGEYGASCTGWSANGPEAFYKIALGVGDNFTVCEAPVSDYIDLAIYLFTDCGDPVSSCVAGDDSGNPECFTFTAATAGTYYLAIDSYSGCGLVTVTIDSPVSDEPMDWGSVKSMYR